MSPVDIRFEQPSRREVTFPLATTAARERTDHTSALVVIGLSLACTALSLFDLLLLATNH